MILQSSFLASPRHMFEIFQDSMAITRYNHHLYIFLTMTVNPNFPRIVSALLSHQQLTDRSDLIDRVFELKQRCLKKEIGKKEFSIKRLRTFTQLNTKNVGFNICTLFCSFIDLTRFEHVIRLIG